MFGALTSCALRPSEHFYGTGESVLFSFQRVVDPRRESQAQHQTLVTTTTLATPIPAQPPTTETNKEKNAENKDGNDKEEEGKLKSLFVSIFVWRFYFTSLFIVYSIIKYILFDYRLA